MSDKDHFIQDALSAAADLELFEYLLEEEGIRASDGQAIPRRAPGQPAPLSFAQRRLWFLEQMDPGSATYNIAGGLRLQGSLDMQALAASLDAILRRHETLRTGFVTIEDTPGQVVHPPSPIPIPISDISSLPRAEHEAKLRELAQAEAQQPFDLSQPPLWRLRLIRLQADEHILLLTLHHIIADGWSLALFVRELARLYAGLVSASPAPLAELAIQYGDYAAWQRQQMASGRLDGEVAYWREQLSNELPVLSLPTDRPRPAVQTHRGASTSISITQEITYRLKELCRSEGATLFMCLLAAVDVLLARYSNQREIVIGTPVANRNRKELEGLIGFFVNTLVLRADLSGNPTFREFLSRMKEVALDAYDHQDVPFEKVVEELRPERTLDHSPLFQVMFALRADWLPTIEVSGLTMRPLEIGTATAKFDLAWEMRESEEGLIAALEYSTDLFDEATAKRLLVHYRSLLAAIAENADQRISDLPLLTPGERRQMLDQWNATTADYPRHTLPQRFEAQAARTPEALALRAAGQQVSYAELNRRANQLAHYLRRQGVGPEARVGVCVERSVEMVVGLLGVLKAGGAYVPLDPAYPNDRLEYMADDAGVKVIVTQERFLAVVGGCDAVPVCMDRDAPQIAAEAEGNANVYASSDNLIYILYTSGSTGKPKGVLVTHAGVMNCLLWMQDAHQLEPSDRLIFKAPLSFDACVWELFWPLMVGASVSIAQPGGEKDATYLVELILDDQVTGLHFIPSMFGVFLEQEGIKGISSLRRVVCGGEALPLETMQRAFERLRCALHNFYGPTEASIGCIDWRCRREVDLSTVPIGGPISNMQAYILDERLEPVPVGVAGELVIGGDGLARGYLKGAELTAEKFIADPYSRLAGGRLYRTGDLARYLADGVIEFLGRRDHQVKIRGFRIELEEVQTVLAGYAAVRECLVVAREEVQGGKRLVAYVVPDAGARVSEKELRGYLRERLPDYMVPSACVVLERMPLTASGKIDRRSLPAPQPIQLEFDDRRVAPRDPMEEVVAATWSHALGLERVGIQDNFFNLGGHSLLAAQVALRLRAAFQVEVPVRKLFEHSTVETLASWIKSQRMVDLSIHAPLTRRTSGNCAPLSSAQERLWFLDQLEAEKAIYNMVAAVRLTGELHAAVLEESINEIIRRHESLRTTFHSDGGTAMQVIHHFEPIALQVINLTEIIESRREACMQDILAEHTRRPFDLTRGPLLRAILLREAENAHVFAVVMHHIITDGWSMGVLTRELAALYEAFLQGQPSPLAEPDVQYADFATWQRQWLGGEALQKQLAYWRKQLHGVRPALELPTDRARPPVQSFRGATIHTSLSPALTEQLRRMCSQESLTLYMALLAALQTLLARYANQTDLTVGSPIASRNQPEIEGLIGFFANTLVMRTDLSGNPGFRELLARVREMALDAFAHQDLPFESLVEQLNPVRDLSHSPLFQVLFVLQNAPGGELALPGLSLTPFEVQTGLTHFELTLSMSEEDGKLIASWEYSTDLFDEPTIRRMAEHFEVLLTHAVADPGRRIADLPLLSETERRLLLDGFNAETASYPRDACVHLMFSAQAERTPDTVAVEFGNRCLTYRQLNARANCLAHHLKRLGSGPDLLVGMCIDCSLDMVIGLLGILKSGAAYVPLDPSYPKERLRFMLDGVRALVAERSLLPLLPQVEAPVVGLSDIETAFAGETTTNPEIDAAADHLAYVIYTSGSTGRPKGVAMSHGPIASMIWWQIQSSRATTGTRTAQFASLSFDVSFQEIISTLCSGGTLVLVSEETRQDAERFGRMLESAQIERLFAPPVMLQQLAEQAEARDILPHSLREIMTAGEQLKITPQIERFFTRLANCTLHNHYGPSETHAATAFVLDGDARDWPRLPPIGKVLPHTRIYILDERLEPVPVGVAGELVIGGDGLARGYLNGAELTAEKFIADPYSGQAGGRLYRTGDLARYLADGVIEFLGRRDHQVKIRGFRVELGEIESALERHTAVRQAVAIAWEHKPGLKQLVAYIVPQSGAQPSGSELREYLREKLPGYMWPSAFLTVAELPLTRSGKVDRAALPMPAIERLELATDYVPPRNPIEEILAAIWSEVLGVERLGIHDNFFDLGGHSIIAMRLISRLRDAFDSDFPLRKLFEHPTVAELAEAVAAEAQGDQIRQSQSLAPAPIDRRNVPSFAQERMWFLHQLDPCSAAYNMPAAVRLRGQLNLPALQSSFNEILRRHESLRTSFALNEGQIIRCVENYKSSRLVIEDFATASESDREARLWEMAQAEAQQPFDLSQPPLWRLRLIRLQTDEHVLLLTLHHIIADGWSLALFVRELARLYAGLVSASPAPLAELAIQYGDYAAWQRQQMASGRLDSEVAYWRGQLSSELPVLSLPTDRPRPAVQSYQGSSVAIDIRRDLRDKLQEVCRREDATLFMCLLAAFNVLLHRYSGQDDILVGVPVANRNHRNVEGLIGLFTNTLVMRVALQRGATFRELVRQVRAVALGAYAHQEIPFEKVVESVRPERALSHAPLFQVAFTVQNMPLPALELTGLTLQLMNVDNRTAKFDLTFVVEESEEGLSIAAQYNADLFDEATAIRMLNHYAVLLQSAVTNAGQAISDLPLLTPGERRQMLDQWNATTADYPRHTLPQRFEAQVARTPEAVALHWAGEQVSYAELNRRANQLAHYLRRQGVGPEARVGVCVERSVEMVVGLLGVLKAGGAYVPLDPAYPNDRLEYILEDAQAPVLLIQERFCEGLPELKARVVCLDRLLEELDHESTADPMPLTEPSNLAYIIYTSGSTGRPKGVEVAHAGLINLCSWYQRTYQVNCTDRMSLAAGLTFDALVWELWSCLTAGASLHIPDEATRLHPATFVEWMIAEAVTVSFLPTPMAEAVLNEPRLSDVRLRYLMTGGDQLSRWPQPEHRFLLVNNYGPTESTVVATSAVIETTNQQHGNPPIGKPIANTAVYVLDARLNPVPIGVTGELYVGGEGLARGYVRGAASTAEKFLPNLFSRTPGARLYRTGDFVRYLPGGDLAYLGRDDDQVKIRGCRVELREIEAALSRSAAVAEAIVIVKDDTSAGKQLVAYVVSRPGQSPTAEELRNQLRQKLPSYMMPAAIVLLDQLPMTANGKVDRHRLPQPDDSIDKARGQFVAPTTKLERAIAAIWQEGLEVDGVGVYDNLFDLGGHSLLLIQIHSKMQATLGREFPIIKLFEFPTVRLIAEHLSRKAGELPAQSENLARGRARRESLAGRARHKTKGR